MHKSDTSMGSDTASANKGPSSTIASTSASPNLRQEPEKMSVADQKPASKSSYRGVRLRASRACAVCHSRKVRCDVTQRYPCTNCAAFQCECVVPSRSVAMPGPIAGSLTPGVRKGRKRKGSEFSGSPAGSETGSPRACPPTTQPETSVLYKPELKSLPDLANDPAFLGSASHLGLFMMKQMERDSATAQLWEQNDARASDGSAATSRINSAGTHEATTRQTSASSSCHNSRIGSPATGSQPGQPAGAAAGAAGAAGAARAAEAAAVGAAGAGSGAGEVGGGNGAGGVPAAPTALVDRETTAMLEIAGAFCTPPKALAEALMETFFLRIHPLLPVVDRSEFMRQWTTAAPGQPGGPPLLLSQAIFCASANVCRHHSLLDSNGRNNSAKIGLYRRAKLLFDAGFEQDQEVVFCSALILSLALDAPDKASNNVFYWARTALTIAHSIGLHRRAPRGSQTDYKQRMRKRWWWSLFVRDRSVSTAYGRPMGISLEDSDVPMIETSDFDEQQPEAANAGPALPPVQEHVLIFIYQVKLAEITGIILRQQYSVGAERLRALHRVPDISQCDLALATWVRNLPAEIRYVPREPARHGYLQAVLHLQYYTTLCLAHRPQVVNYVDDEKRGETLPQYPSWGIAFHAAHMIVKVLENLGKHGELVVLPAAAVYSCFTALIMLLFQSESRDTDARSKARDALESLLASTNELGKLYEVARQITKYSPVLLQSTLFKEQQANDSNNNEPWQHSAPLTPSSQTNPSPQPPSLAQSQPAQTQPAQVQQPQQVQQQQQPGMGGAPVAQAPRSFGVPLAYQGAQQNGFQNLQTQPSLQSQPNFSNKQSGMSVLGVPIPSINAPSVVYPPHAAQGYYYGGSAADFGAASHALGNMPGSHVGYAVMASAVAGANGINTSADWETVPPPVPIHIPQQTPAQRAPEASIPQQMPQQAPQMPQVMQATRPMLPPVNQQLAQFPPQPEIQLGQPSMPMPNQLQPQGQPQTQGQLQIPPQQAHMHAKPQFYHTMPNSAAAHEPSPGPRQSIQMVTLASGMPRNNIEPQHLFGEETLLENACEERVDGDGHHVLAPEMLNMESWVQHLTQAPR